MFAIGHNIGLTQNIKTIIEFNKNSISLLTTTNADVVNDIATNKINAARA